MNYTGKDSARTETLKSFSEKMRFLCGAEKRPKIDRSDFDLEALGRSLPFWGRYPRSPQVSANVGGTRLGPRPATGKTDQDNRTRRDHDESKKVKHATPPVCQNRPVLFIRSTARIELGISTQPTGLHSQGVHNRPRLFSGGARSLRPSRSPLRRPHCASNDAPNATSVHLWN